MSESAPPTYVYKIVPAQPPSPLPTDLPLSELDRADGFIHMSTAQQVSLFVFLIFDCQAFHVPVILPPLYDSNVDGLQVPGTLGRFFKDVRTLWIMRIPYARVVGRTRWENTFPHLYGGEFGAAEVESVEEFTRGGSSSGEKQNEAVEEWEAVLERKKEWLV
ncbi:DUF952 domain-containing protein [Microdochium nivale]|nr:DUF952 domain-containing protein [Microdochium nivale]